MDDETKIVALALFTRALLLKLEPNEGIVVEGVNGSTYIVWRREETKEIVVSENSHNLPIGEIVWTHDGSMN
jgi:hypothetical protein